MENFTRVSAFKKAIRSKAFPLLILFIIMIAMFAVLAPFNDANFLTTRTFISILRDLSVPGFLAIGAGCLMVSGGIDLSQSTVAALTGVTVAVSVGWWGLPWYAAILIAMVISLAVGMINAILVNELNMMPFIATMAMSTVVRSIMMLIATDQTGQMQGAINYNDPTLALIGNYEIGGMVPATIIVMLVAFIFYGLLLSKTKFGRSLYLIGGNPIAAKLAGINSKKTSYILFMNCSLMGGLSGLIYTSRVKQGSLSALATDQFTGLTAAILGGISFGGGSGGMGGAFIGLLVIKTFNKGMTIIGASSYVTNVLSGALLLAALSFDYYSQRRQRKRVGA